jgi:hypothetical protein
MGSVPGSRYGKSEVLELDLSGYATCSFKHIGVYLRDAMTVPDRLRGD